MTVDEKFTRLSEWAYITVGTPGFVEQWSDNDVIISLERLKNWVADVDFFIDGPGKGFKLRTDSFAEKTFEELVEAMWVFYTRKYPKQFD
jgi:hypothetical protein